MNNIIKTWKRRRAAEKDAERMRYLRQRFQLADKGGRIWVTFDDTAIAVVSSDMSMDECYEMLESCRNCAVAYRYGHDLTTKEDDACVDAVAVMN